jgi:hypothetical protein
MEQEFSLYIVFFVLDVGFVRYVYGYMFDMILEQEYDIKTGLLIWMHILMVCLY